MTTVFHTWGHGRFIEIQSSLRSKNCHRTNYSPNFLGGSFSNRDNVRPPIQFRREGQPQHLKRYFFSRTDPFILTSIKPLLLGRSIIQMSLFSTEINKKLITSVHQVSKIRSKFRSQFSLLPHIRCLITPRIESSIISTDSNTTYNTVRKIINV